MAHADVVRFKTFGAFQVSAPTGRDMTPRSQKACALLAILLESPRMSRSRAVLQDMLWSDREQAQGAASLRQALTVIRQAFGDERDVLRADARIVSLDEARVRYEREPGDGEFLEGILVRDPEFEDWLRDRRLAFEDAAEKRAAEPRSTVPRSDLQTMPVLYLSSGEDGGVARFVLQAISKGVAEWGAVDIRMARSLDQLGAAAAYGLDVSDRTFGKSAMIRAAMTSLSDGRVLWSDIATLKLQDGLANNVALARLINDGIDRTNGALAAERPDDVLFQPVRQMFATQGRDHENIMRRLEQGYSATGRGIYSAWRAYMTIYEAVGGSGADQRALKGEAEELVQQALESEPHNPTVLAVASMVSSTTLLNFPVARELAQKSLALDHGNPLAWAFLAAVNAYEGRAGDSFRQISRARRLAGEGPHRYIIDGLGCMASLLTGRIDTAIQIGETVRARVPNYAPNLRYLLAAYLAEKNMPKVEEIVERLRQIEPGFELSLLAEPDYPVDSLRRGNVLQLTSLPKDI